MRSKILLTTTAVAAIFAVVSLASGEGVSQGTNEPHKGAQSSDSQQQRQGKGASPTGQQDKGTAQRQDKGTSGQQGAQGDQGKGASSTGQQDKGTAQSQDKGTSGQQGAQGDQGKGASSTGQQDKGTAQRQDKGTSGQQGAQGDQGKGASPTGQQDKGTAQRQDKGTSGQQGAQGDQGKGASPTGQQGTTSQTSGVNPRNQTQRQSPSTKDEGQPGAQPGIDLSAEQRTRIRDIVLNTSNAPRVASPKFSVSVGTVVPPSVRFVRLPAPIAEIYPAWRDYDYIV